MDGHVKDDSMVQQRNYRYARMLWEFWKRDSELFPPEILANAKGLHNQPHAVLFVFDGSVEEIPDGEEETRFYREIIQMCRAKGYANPQASNNRDTYSAGCQIDPLPSGQSGLPLRPSDAGDLEAASLAALVGPLGREAWAFGWAIAFEYGVLVPCQAALSSARMREVEEWIWKAEAEGLAPEEIIPARQRLKMLAQENRSIHWKREEEKDEKRKAQALELLKAEELLRKVVAEVATSKKEICENGEAGPTDEQVAAKLKDTIVQAYNAGADAKLLISARHKLKLLEPEPVTSEPKQRSFAKEMIQAMKEKLFGTKSTRTPHFERGWNCADDMPCIGLERVARYCVQINVVQDGPSAFFFEEKNVDALQCIIDDALKQGVQLQGLEAARRKLAEWGAKPLDAAKRTPTTSSTVQLRIEDRSSLHFCLAQETTLRGAVEFLEQSLSLERTLAEQPEFLEKGAALACRSCA
eukprot:g19867.t1